MKTYELVISQEDGLTHAQMIPLTGGRYVLVEETRDEIERLRKVLRCARHLRENQALCSSPIEEDERQYEAIWDALSAALDAAGEE